LRGLNQQGQSRLSRLLARARRIGRRVPLVIPDVAGELHDVAPSGPGRTAFFPRFSTIDEYDAWAEAHAALLDSRANFEKALIPRSDYFAIGGYCAVCHRDSAFTVDFLYSAANQEGVRVPNWRERLVCRRCKLPNRQRAMIDFMESQLEFGRSTTIYVTEQTTPFFRALKNRYPNTIGSELLGDGTLPGQSNKLGLRNEDLTQLSLREGSVDAICTADVLEHVPEYGRAICECFRCLKPGGWLMISVPFLLESAQTLVRARLDVRGSIEHLLAPEYHGDPLNAQGVLCYYHFGWDLLERLSGAGFLGSSLYFYWSCRRGYLGGLQFLISARKPRSAT